MLGHRRLIRVARLSSPRSPSGPLTPEGGESAGFRYGTQSPETSNEEINPAPWVSTHS